MVRSLSVTVMEAISHPSGRASKEDGSIHFILLISEPLEAAHHNI
jgi:hypothetical protein